MRNYFFVVSLLSRTAIGVTSFAVCKNNEKKTPSDGEVTYCKINGSSESFATAPYEGSGQLCFNALQIRHRFSPICKCLVSGSGCLPCRSYTTDEQMCLVPSSFVCVCMCFGW